MHRRTLLAGAAAGSLASSLPLGQWKQPWAFRTTLKNFVRCGDMLFWGVERA